MKDKHDELHKRNTAGAPIKRLEEPEVVNEADKAKGTGTYTGNREQFQAFVNSVASKFGVQSPVFKVTDTVQASPWKNKLPDLPSRQVDYEKWVIAWALLEPEIKKYPANATNFDELRAHLREQNMNFGDDTIRKIVKLGLAGKMPPRSDF